MINICILQIEEIHLLIILYMHTHRSCGLGLAALLQFSATSATTSISMKVPTISARHPPEGVTDVRMV